MLTVKSSSGLKPKRFRYYGDDDGDDVDGDDADDVYDVCVKCH